MFEDTRDLYQQAILRHSRQPAHQRRLAAPDAAARGDNPMCGDRVEVQLRYAPDGALAEVAFDARGCAISIASADLMADAVRGRAPDEARAISARFAAMARTGACPENDPVLDALRPLSGVHEYPSRINCATLPWHALVAALDGEKEAGRE